MQAHPNAPKPSVLLSEALKLFGRNGSRWIKGQMKVSPGERHCRHVYPQGAFCSYGAVMEVNTDNQELALHYLHKAIPTAFVRRNCGRSVTSYNDTPNRSFAQIRKLFKRAIVIAKKAGD